MKNLIKNPHKLKSYRKVFIYFLMTVFMNYSNGCMTTELATVSAGSIDESYAKNIAKIKLKDGTFILCKDKLVKIYRNSDSADVIIITSSEITDSVKTGSSSYSYKTKWTDRKINMNEVSRIYVEESRFNPVILLIAGGFIILVAAIALIGSSSSGSDNTGIILPPIK